MKEAFRLGSIYVIQLVQSNMRYMTGALILHFGVRINI